MVNEKQPKKKTIKENFKRLFYGEYAEYNAYQLRKLLGGMVVNAKSVSEAYEQALGNSPFVGVDKEKYELQELKEECFIPRIITPKK